MSDYLESNNIVAFPRRRRAPRCSPSMTLEMASKAKTMVLQLGMAQHEVAAKLGVNPGRVSEVIHGRKFKEAPFASLDEIA